MDCGCALVARTLVIRPASVVLVTGPKTQGGDPAPLVEDERGERVRGQPAQGQYGLAAVVGQRRVGDVARAEEGACGLGAFSQIDPHELHRLTRVLDLGQVRCRPGTSLTQGGHHEAQVFRTTTLPRSSVRDQALPVSVSPARSNAVPRSEAGSARLCHPRRCSPSASRSWPARRSSWPVRRTRRRPRQPQTPTTVRHGRQVVARELVASPRPCRP